MKIIKKNVSRRRGLGRLLFTALPFAITMVMAMAQLSVALADDNNIPIAVDDSYSMEMNTTLIVAAPGVLANDTDPSGDNFLRVIVSPNTIHPSNGTGGVGMVGKLVYTPNTDFVGTDSLTYTVKNNYGQSTATVVIEVEPPVNDTGLIGHWKFDEESGTVAEDSSAYANDGVLSGGSSFSTDDPAPMTTGDNPGALSVDGSTGTVTIPNCAVNQLTSNFTLMGWIKTDTASGYQFLIATDRTNSSNGWSFGLFYKRLLIYAHGTGYYYLAKDVITAGQWNHIAAVMDEENNVSFYLNGVLAGEVAGSGALTADTDDNLLIGSDTGDRFFDGMIDDVRVYNRALSASEISDAVSVAPCSELSLRTRVMLGEDSGTIELDGTCTYTLTSAADSSYGGSGLYITSAATIEGNGATIERSESADQFRILRTSSSIAPTIRNLTLRNGNIAGYGAGLWAFGDVTLENVHFENNITDNSSASYSGGALYVYGNLTVDRCSFLDNQSGWGGAIRFFGDTGTITNSIFADNQSTNTGAAIRSSGTDGSLSIVNNTFANKYKSENDAINVNGPTTMQNNIFYNFTTGLVASGETAVVNEDYNLFAFVDADLKIYSDAVINSGGNNRVAASPRFVDQDADDYHLQQNSPAIDLGVDAGLTVDADENQRPYGSTADIGAYEYQGEGLPSISITKAGPAFAAESGQTQFVLTVFNEGVTTLDDLRVVDALPTGATYVTGSVSDGGTLSGSTLTWDLPSMAPNSTQRIWYSVTADQDLVSENYSVTSSSDPSITDTGTSFITPYKAASAALGFTPFPDGYSFANYGSPTLDTDITASQMQTIYGAGVCNGGEDSPCVLTAAAEEERQALAAWGSGGHCAGLAASSLWIYDHEDVFPEDYQAGAINTYDIAQSNARNLIQLYHCTQIKNPVNQTGLEPFTAAEGGVAIVDKLMENFSDPNADNRYTIAFWKLDWSGGHAVTPYAVTKVDNDTYWVYVYDVNYPKNYDRVFKVTYSTGEWVYEGGAINPDAPVSTYVGNAETGNIGKFRLKSLRWAEKFPKECFGGCVDVAEEAAAETLVSSAYEFDLDGEGSLMITRDDGLRAGIDPETGEFIAEIPGAEQIPVVNGPLNIPNNIRIPHEAGHTYSMSIADRPSAYGNRTAPANLNIVGQGFVTRLTGLRIDSAEDAVDSGSASSGTNDVMGVTFDGDHHGLTFQASELDSDTPDLSMAVSRSGAPDYAFKVTGAEVAQGRSLGVSIDVDTGRLIVENDDPAENSYSLTVERLDTDNTKLTYTFSSLSDEGSEEGEYINLGETWTGGSPTLTHGEPDPGDAIDQLQLIINTVNSFDNDVFKNKNMKNALTNKVNAIITNVEDGYYAEAVSKLKNDIMKKTDGCTDAGAPDSNDWIIECYAQDDLYPLVTGAISLLNLL
ncbi:LamG-like jellyroll fold domain-containing protein [uncultured Desulfobacter sp.]|uniref:LamG-like jellyroll fold domain-containing protein n=1 Tax=uncultured Desulfobacter sp. TaxID=240139 RepID=UPI0029F4F2F3|nr:LamG-like jellyroll fold domain-containing protein [uncultured Desulfobacter sp.]